MPLFNPLQQEWDEHFRQDADATVVGMTPVGRATVAALRMNAPIAKTARAVQRMLGLV